MGVWKPLGTVTASGLTSQEGHSSSGKVGSSPPGQRREPAAPQRSGQNKTGRAASHVCQWLLRSRMALCRHTWPRFEECCAVLLPDQVSSRDPRPQKTCNKQESLSQSFSGHYLYVWSPQFVSSFKCRKLFSTKTVVETYIAIKQHNFYHVWLADSFFLSLCLHM